MDGTVLGAPRRRPVLRALAWTAVAGWAAVIWYFSSLPSPPAPEEIPDVVGHALEYGLLATLLWGAMESWLGWRPGWMRAAAIVGLCALYGASDEIHQGFVPGRDPSLRDLAADVTGAFAAAGGLATLAFLLRRRSGRRGESSLELTLLSRADCHLCDEAEAVLMAVQAETPFRYTKVDVDKDDGLRARFGEEVPVVLLEGRKIFKHRVDAERLRRRLREGRGFS